MCFLSLFTAPVVVNLTSPITLTFKVKAISENLLAAYWDPLANGKNVLSLFLSVDLKFLSLSLKMLVSEAEIKKKRSVVIK